MNEGHTSIIPATPEPPPVFVDATGRRRRRVRRLAFGLGLLGLIYPALVGVSLVGGPADPRTVLPFPERADQTQEISSITNPVATETSPGQHRLTRTASPSTGPRRTTTAKPTRHPTSPSSPSSPSSDLPKPH